MKQGLDIKPLYPTRTRTLTPHASLNPYTYRHTRMHPEISLHTYTHTLPAK